MAILIAEIILILILILNIPLALNTQKKFINSCNGECKKFNDANLKKFSILFIVVLVLAILLVFLSNKDFFLLAPALMSFLLVGSVKNAMLIGKTKLYFRECVVPLTEIKAAELTYTGKGKIMILFIMNNDHKFGYAHNKPDVPQAIANTIEELGIPVTDKIHKKVNSDVNIPEGDAATPIEDTSEE
ncbi:hypothetical protein [uncultured Clostridium sp.]|uniref:hypothetical protein n=1 Tax=uncultured Clostridium sp. TaxID=59620 RepID=UPI00260D8510|nr:hypothetical protein [uncultured Clostridium sp.]